MSNGYHRMSLAEREELSIYYAQGESLRAIVRSLNRSPSTISRELTRNRTGFYYRVVTAQNKAHKRCHRKPRRLAVDERLRHTVLSLLRRQWSRSAAVQIGRITRPKSSRFHRLDYCNS